MQRRSVRAAGILLAAIVLTLPTAAFAAEGAASVNSEAIFIAELGLLLLVGRRLGETLFFGETAASVLERSDTSNLFVAS